MSRAEAARRLGAPLVKCVECLAMAHERVSVLLRWEGASGFVCSLHCAESFAGKYDGVVSARRWSVKLEGLEHIGLREKLGQPWSFTDRGNALWIEEQVERLRAAGEIL